MFTLSQSRSAVITGRTFVIKDKNVFVFNRELDCEFQNILPTIIIFLGNPTF